MAKAGSGPDKGKGKGKGGDAIAPGVNSDALWFKAPPSWQPTINSVAARFNLDYTGDRTQQAAQLPEEVQALPIFPDWLAGKLQGKLSSPFWEVAKPQKNQHCLDLGCGIGFLLYPWREWDAYFHGQDVSSEACKILTARAPQLNSKLFKGVKSAPAHQLDYAPGTFDLAIATGLSCYYPIAYWAAVLQAVKPVLKDGAVFVFDVLDDQSAIAENWAILETYLGAEVFLEPEAHWKGLLKDLGAKVVKTQPGDVFVQYKVKFA
jgi:SAM-dependent methyltransferase